MNEGRGEVRSRPAGRVRRRSGRRIALVLVGVSVLVLGLGLAMSLNAPIPPVNYGIFRM